jgi:hypothetical protein
MIALAVCTEELAEIVRDAMQCFNTYVEDTLLTLNNIWVKVADVRFAYRLYQMRKLLFTSRKVQHKVQRKAPCSLAAYLLIETQSIILPFQATVVGVPEVEHSSITEHSNDRGVRKHSLPSKNGFQASKMERCGDDITDTKPMISNYAEGGTGNERKIPYNSLSKELRVAQRVPPLPSLVMNFRPYLKVCVPLLANKSGTFCVPSEVRVLLRKLMNYAIGTDKHNALVSLRAQQTPIQAEKRGHLPVRYPQPCKRARR